MRTHSRTSFNVSEGLGTSLVTGADSDMSGANNWANSVGGPWGTIDINTTVAGKMYCLGDGGVGDWCRLDSKVSAAAGFKYYFMINGRLNAGASSAIRFGNHLATSGCYVEFTPTGTESGFGGYFLTSGTDAHIYIGMAGASLNGIAFEFDDVVLYQVVRR